MRKNLLKYFNSWFRITHNLSNDMGVSGNVLKRPENERTFFFYQLTFFGKLAMPRPVAASNAFYRRICGQSTSYHWVCMACFIGIFSQRMVSFKAKDCKADTLRPTKRLANQKKRK